MTARHVVAYVPDLMDRSRLAAVAGIELTFVPSPDQLAEAARTARLVVVDLSRPGVLEVLASGLGPPVVGFASHVDRDLLAAAAAAGCPDPLPRSRFFSHVTEILGG